MLFDMESFMDKVKDRLVDASDGLNTFIDDINTNRNTLDVARYGFHIALDTLDYDNGVFYFWQKGLVNVDPYICVYPVSHSTNDDDIDTMEIAVSISFYDKADGFEPERKLLRYSQALRKCLLRKRFSSYFSGLSVRNLGYEAIEDDSTSDNISLYSAKVGISGDVTNE